MGQQADEYFAGLDPFSTGAAVSWAGDGPMPVWFDVAREFTERWHHQQQIRDATGRPGLYEKRIFEPVLDTFVRGMPHTFRDVETASGVVVQLSVTGALTKTWSLVRGDGNWKLFDGGDQRKDAAVTLKAEDAWKVFTRGVRGEEAVRRSELSGDRWLGEKILQMVSVIA
jgi:hypothetical protein